MDIEKYTNEKGEVAVLVSYGYGAGWSTWNHEYEDFLTFDKGLVEMSLNNASKEDVEKYVQEKTGAEYVCVLGWPCSIKYLAPGSQFTIEEYDGAESLRLISDLCHVA